MRIPVKERKFPTLALAYALAFSLACPANVRPAFAETPAVLQKAPATKRERLDHRFREITKKTFKDYFPSTNVSQKASFGELKINDALRNHFEEDFRFVVTRGGQKNSWNAARFQAWWDKNKDAVLTPAQIKSWEDMPVETLVAACYVKFAADEAENNQTKFRAMLEHYVDNEWVLWGLDGTVAGVGAVAGFVGSSLYTAFTVAIMGDFLRAYTDSLTNTPKQVITVIGNEHTGWLSAPLAEKGQGYVNYRQKKADERRRRKAEKRAERARRNGLPTSEQLMSAEERAKSLSSNLAENAERHLALTGIEKQMTAPPADAAKLLDPRFLPGLTVEQYDKNLATFNKQWSQIVITWNTTTLASAQNGRSLMTDGVIFRMKDFARDAAVYESKMELYRQGIEANKRSLAAVKEAERTRLEQKTLESLHLAGTSEGTAAERRAEMAKIVSDKEAGLKRIADEEILLQAKATEFLDTVDSLAALEFNGQTPDWAKARGLEEELRQLGVSPATLAELKESQRARMISRRQLVGSLAAQMLHDMMYSEFNRKMPDSLQRVLMAMRTEFGAPHFQKMFAEEINEVLRKAGIEIGREVAESGKALAEQAVAAARAKDEVEALHAAIEKATPKGKLGRLKDVAGRMYSVRGGKFVVDGCAAGFALLGKAKPQK